MGTPIEMTDVTMGTQPVYTGNDWPLISICSGTDDFSKQVRIINRSEFTGNQSEEVGVDALVTVITTHWNTEG
jgi:hypothetical protein